MARSGRAWVGLLALLLASCDEGSSKKMQPEPDPPSKGGEAPVTEPECFLDDDEDGWCDDKYTYVPYDEEDCDDNDPARNPGATELSNAIDDDCDGIVDNGVTSACPLTIDEPAGGCEQVVTLEAGPDHACLLTDGGRVLCWGMNYLGALGTPEVVNSSVPIAVPGVAAATALTVNGRLACALEPGRAICWGGDSVFPYAIALPDDTTRIAIGGGLYALDGSGTLWRRPVWPVDDAPLEFAMVASEISELADGGGTVCGRTAMGQLTCWNPEGEAVELAASGVEAFQVGSTAVVCFKQEGQLLCNEGGSPAPVAGNGSAIGFDVGRDFACAFNEAGRLACWSAAGPTTVDDAAAIALGDHFGCVLRQSGRVSCWGNRDGGVLGNGISAPYNESEPVDVLPAPSLDLPEYVLLGDEPLGACDSLHDLSLVVGSNDYQWNVHSALAACRSECEIRLDTAACFASCAENPNLSEACFGCYITLAGCSGPDCYAEFVGCAGFPIDFASAVDNAPRFDCLGAGCMRGAKLGEACEEPTDCYTGNCEALPQAPDSKVCVAAQGSSCGQNSGYCNCQRGSAIGASSGHCGGCDSEGRVASTDGDCYRECTDYNYCAVGQSCRPFTSGERRYCSNIPP